MMARRVQSRKIYISVLLLESFLLRPGTFGLALALRLCRAEKSYKRAHSVDMQHTYHKCTSKLFIKQFRITKLQGEAKLFGPSLHHLCHLPLQGTLPLHMSLNTPLSTGFLQLKILQSRHISLDLLLKLLQLLFLPEGSCQWILFVLND